MTLCCYVRGLLARRANSTRLFPFRSGRSAFDQPEVMLGVLEEVLCLNSFTGLRSGTRTHQILIEMTLPEDSLVGLSRRTMPVAGLRFLFGASPVIGFQISGLLFRQVRAMRNGIPDKVGSISLESRHRVIRSSARAHSVHYNVAHDLHFDESVKRLMAFQRSCSRPGSNCS